MQAIEVCELIRTAELFCTPMAHFVYSRGINSVQDKWTQRDSVFEQIIVVLYCVL